MVYSVYSVYYVPSEDRCKRLNTKKSTCICGIYGLAGLLACRALFLGSFRRLALTRLDMAGNHPIVQGSAEYTERSQDVTVGSFLKRIYGMVY
jgi:hypothetical protein